MKSNNFFSVPSDWLSLTVPATYPWEEAMKIQKIVSERKAKYHPEAVLATFTPWANHPEAPTRHKPRQCTNTTKYYIIYIILQDYI